MKHQFESNRPEGARWQRRAIRRLNHALRRLHWLVAGTRIELVDIDAAAVGVDKRCRVELVLRGAAPVVLSATARTWQDSLEAVASRLRQHLVAHLRRHSGLGNRTLALAPLPVRVAPPLGAAMALRQRTR